MKNKAIRASLVSKLSDVEASNMMAFCSDLIRNEKYLKFHDTYKKLYENGDTSDEAVCVAIKYFVAELPVCLNVPDIISISPSLYAYKYPPSDFLTSVRDKNNPFSYVSSKQDYFAVNFS